MVNQVVLKTAEKAGSTFKLCKEELVQVVDRQPVLSYIDELANPGNKLVSQLRDVMVQKAQEGSGDGIEVLN